MELDFEIDKITKSIESVETGERFETQVVPITKADLKEITKKNGWLFDWKIEFSQPERQVYKLIAEKEPSVIQGLVAFEKWDKDKLVYMPLVESAPFNVGKKKLYEGVCGNLVAYGCKLSKEYGFGGYLYFEAKTALIEHYKKKLRATHICGQKIAIEFAAADRLIGSYFHEQKE